MQHFPLPMKNHVPQQVIENKLSRNHYLADDALPHIVLANHIDQRVKELLINVCPAKRYTLNADQDLTIDVTGCLECGACRLVAPPQAFTRWQYPENGLGIDLRFG